MKKIKFIFTISIIFINSISLFSQWVKIAQFSNNQFSKIINYNGDLLIGTDTVFKSTDLGQSWSHFYKPQNSWEINALNIVNGNIWVSNNYINSYTTNNGLNWINVNLNQFVYTFYAFNYNRIYAGTESSKCFYTTNNGINWSQCTGIWDDVICFEAASNKLLAGTSLGLFCSVNSIDWTIIPSIPSVYVSDIKNKGAIIFIATAFGIWSSIDNGTNWIQTNYGTNGNNGVSSLEYYNQYTFAGTINNGFYMTSNNGVNWIQRSEGLGNKTILSLAIINNIIFAETAIDGLWKRPLNEIVDVRKIESIIPSSFSLSQNYPNPFNPNTIIKFQIPKMENGKNENEFVSLKVFDLLGREVATLVNEKLQPGTYEIPFSISQFSDKQIPSGVYFYKLTAGNYSETKKMILIK